MEGHINAQAFSFTLILEWFQHSYDQTHTEIKVHLSKSVLWNVYRQEEQAAGAQAGEDLCQPSGYKRRLRASQSPNETKSHNVQGRLTSIYTQKNVTLHQIDISMCNCWISRQLFP